MERRRPGAELPISHAEPKTPTDTQRRSHCLFLPLMLEQHRRSHVMAKPLDILIVEDVPEDARAIEEQLREDGLSFVTRRVETRSALIAEIQLRTPDIVLSDFTLPEFNALEALHALQEQGWEIPFILVTGNRSEEVAVECIKEGADDYILKASLRRLPSSILNTLKKRAAEREKIRAEAALRRSEEQYRLIAENTRDLISLLDPQGTFLYASPSFQPCLGHISHQLVGTDSFRLIHPEDRVVLRGALSQALQTRVGQTAEVRVLHQAGSWLTFESAANWIWDGEERPQQAVVVSRDISQRKLAEETLRNLPRLILHAQEAERRRVARDLHDSVNQILSSVMFRFQSVQERLRDRFPEESEQTGKARDLLEKAIKEVRLISRNLRPSELDDLGLVPALRSLIDEFVERTGLPVRFHPLEVVLSTETELHLYRIIQEGLANIEKHAGATSVELTFTREENGLAVRLQDNGTGLDAHRAARARLNEPKGPSMGLVDMQERASAMGGRFHCSSTTDRGTILHIHLPCQWPDPVTQRTREKKSKENQTAAR